MISRGVKEFISGVDGVLEANSFETMCLYEKEKAKGYSWESSGSGFGVSTRKTFLSLTKIKVRGKEILVINPTSMRVDWREIEWWLSDNLPVASLNRSDAMNFHNLF